MLGVVLALIVGLVAGALNGFLISRLKITPILATLGTSQVFTGLALVLTGGPAIVGFPEAWTFIGNGKLFGIAFPFVLFVALAGVIGFVLTRTPFGTRLMLIGANAKAARFAGLDTDRIVFHSYVLTGFLASIAGLILSGRTNAAKSDYGNSYLLQAVLVAVLGGTNPGGGRGTVLGVSIAVIALMLLSSGFQILRFSNFLIDFIWGGFLLLVIAINVTQSRNRQR
jgi:simple sugar transport system permease protein